MTAKSSGLLRQAFRYGPPATVISQNDQIARDPASWFQAEPADDRVRTVPRRLGGATVNFAEMLAPMPALGVHVLPGGRAYGPRGLTFTTDGKLIQETTWHGDDIVKASLPPLLQPPKRLRGTCLSLISEFAAVNYAHYILDCLSRLGIAEKAGWPLTQIDKVYLYEPPSASARALLGALGIDQQKCVWANQVRNIVSDRLLVTTYPGTRRNYAPIVPDTLSRPFNAVQSAGRRIFVPRRGTRRLTNEAEIEAISMEQGFDIYDFETVENEFEYFRSASLVVGPHGAGLSNWAFCHAGTRVFELVPSDHVHPYFYTLAESAGLDYSYMVGESTGQRPAGSSGPSPYDFFIDPKAYRAALDILIGEG